MTNEVSNGFNGSKRSVYLLTKSPGGPPVPSWVTFTFICGCDSEDMAAWVAKQLSTSTGHEYRYTNSQGKLASPVQAG